MNLMMWFPLWVWTFIILMWWLMSIAQLIGFAESTTSSKFNACEYIPLYVLVHGLNDITVLLSEKNGVLRYQWIPSGKKVFG
jgi:hypothetical protein